MSNPKNPNEFDDLDAEATIMSPNVSQDLLNMGPKSPGAQSPAPTPPPATPTYYPPPDTPMTPPPPSSVLPQRPSGTREMHTTPDSSGPFVPQSGSYQPPKSAGSSQGSDETRLLTTPDDISSEQTMVHDASAGPLLPLAKLVIIEGIQKNKEYPILGQEVTFGREKDNAISYPDLSVSRHHFKIHSKKDKFVLEDLGSGNGTIVNQKKVAGTVNLNHGDQIRVGKSIIQFRMIGKDAEATPGTSSSNTLVISLLVVFLLLGATAIGVVYFRNKNSQPPLQPMTQQEQAMREVKRGVKFRQKEKWLEAKLAFQQAIQMDKNNLEARQLLEDTKAEIQTAHFLRKARFLVAQEGEKSYRDAKKLLTNLETKLPPGSTNAPKVWALLADVNKKLKKFEKPKDDPPPPARRPAELKWGFKSYRECRRNCRGRRKRCRRFRRTINGKRLRRWLCVKRGVRRAPPPPPRPRPRPAAATSALQKADAMYRRGNWKGAAEAFAKVGATDKQQLILKFSKVYYQAQRAYRSYNPRTALPPLIQALKLDLIISEGKSVYTRQLRRMLANMYFSKGLLLMGRQAYARAFDQFRRAIRHQPKHSLAKQKVGELRKRAQQWLSQGKAMLQSNPEQGKQFLRKVRRITLRTDALHKKAEQLLNQ